MKIELLNQQNKKFFADIRVGDVFMYEDNVYIKINHSGLSCVDLSSGHCFVIKENTVVVKIHGKFVQTEQP